MGMPFLLNSQAESDVLRERKRQIETEGWSAEHDDGHADGEMAMAAALYASPQPLFAYQQRDGYLAFSDPWPWWNEGDPAPDARGGGRSKAWDKRAKHARRRQLVIAAALIIAEIERLDRTGSCGSPSET